MDKVRFGVVGCGGMGKYHTRYLKDMPEVELVGICDVDEEKSKSFAKEMECLAFTDYKELVKKENIDAVLIATPHYSHPDISIWAFENGVNVLCEKPLAVHIKDANRIIEAYNKHNNLVFGVMYQMRTDSLWRKVKELIETGELGKIFRIDWTVTQWFRTESYYAREEWRGSWSGEGGGVMTNQCPHQLDLACWLFGLPERLIAIANFGKYHRNITVEDEVVALMEYKEEQIFTFKASTGEYPGIDRLEIACDRGCLIVEDSKIKFDRSVRPVSEYLRSAKNSWADPEVWYVEVPIKRSELDGRHEAITKNFVNVILNRGQELIVPGVEGINSVMLGNAMVYSGYYKEWVTLPLAGEEYEKFLKQRVEQENATLRG